MSLKRRLIKVEKAHGVGISITVPIIWGGKDEEHWRKRTEMARAKGWSIKLIRIAVSHALDSKEEAEAAVAEHREVGNKWIPITVHSRTNPSEVLAKWDPGLPDWLQSFIDEHKS